MLGMSLLSFAVKVLSYGTKVPCAGHFCAITKLTFVGISFFMDYAKKNFTLHLFARNADKHRGFRGEGRKSALHHPSSFCHFQILA